MDESCNVTVVITSCNRIQELLITLKSFFEYNTYKQIYKLLIIDDSGIDNCIDMSKTVIPSNIDYEIIYNDRNIGQIPSIDKVYNMIKTEYIFHCEDDWEFYDYGFIEKSLEILISNKKIFTVWLREYKHNKVVQNGHIINDTVHDDNYRLLDVFKERTNIWNGFTFNPGLRRLEDYKLLMPYNQFKDSKFCNCGGVEQALSNLYHNNNFVCAITLNTNGYVKHIGWDNPTLRQY